MTEKGPAEKDQRRLIVHIVFRFDYGGLENGLVNLIHGTSGSGLRHTVIALTDATSFAERLPADVPVHCLGKRPGKDPAAYLRLYRLLRRLKPHVVHTRNIGTLDCALIAFVARVPIRVHGEHGWDVFDPDGSNRKYRLMRRVLSLFVHRIVTVSDDLRCWLVQTVGIPDTKVQHICNGVDTGRFRPRSERDRSVVPAQCTANGGVVVGSVTRFSAIKDPMNLVEAFVALSAVTAESGQAATLVMVGDGELHERARNRLAEAGLSGRAWLPGSRDDVPELLRSLDLFVLGSLKEGISNTILEAMASGLPIIASDAGGNAELINPGVNGELVPPGDRGGLARRLAAYIGDPDLRKTHGKASRARALSQFSLDGMIDKYRSMYFDLLTQ